MLNRYSPSWLLTQLLRQRPRQLKARVLATGTTIHLITRSIIARQNILNYPISGGIRATVCALMTRGNRMQLSPHHTG